MLTALIMFAAEEAGHETSKTFFYVSGSLLAAWAVIVSAIGIKAHETFPPSQGAARGVMGISAFLVALTMISAIVTS